MSMEWGGSTTQDTTVEPSGGVVGLIQRNTDEGRCLFENPSEMLTKAALMCPSAQVVWLGSHVLWSIDSACCTVKEGLYRSQVQHAVLCVIVVSCCWTVVILLRLG